MPSAIITFGSPDLDRVSPVSTAYFVGNIGGGAGGATFYYSDLLSPPDAFVGGDNPLGTDDTTSYLHADNAGLEAAVWARYPDIEGEPVWVQNIRALQSDPIPEIPPAAGGASLTMIAVTRTPSAGEDAADLSIQTYPLDKPSRSFTASIDLVSPGEWVRHEIPIPGLSLNIHDLADMRSVMRFGTGGRVAGSANNDLVLAPWYDVAFFGIRVDWDDVIPATTPVAYNRVVQRGSDGLGMTGGRRVLGARSAQASNRRAAAFR